MPTLDQLSQWLSYKTVKVVQINHWKLGLIHYGITIIILLYVIGWSIIYSKGYQLTATLIGDSNIKVKGIAFNRGANGTQQVWDELDVVYPPKENDAVFITTSFLETLYQTRGKTCPGTTKDSYCNSTYHCPVNQYIEMGWTTGECDETKHHCIMEAWCPMEEPTPQQYLDGVPAFTVFVKQSVRFNHWNYIVNNVGSKLTPNLNLFTVGDMLEQAKVNYGDIQGTGCLIVVSSVWNCDFDHSLKECKPKFTFTRIDTPDQFSPGYNFRYYNKYRIRDNTTGELVEYRDMYKVWGPRFIFLTSGIGGKFNLVPLLITFGSGLALLGVATVVSDLIALHVLPMKKAYNRVKFEEFDSRVHMVNHVEDPTEQSPLLNQK